MSATASRYAARALLRKARQRFAKARKAEHEYARHLRKIARHVGDVARLYAAGGNEALDELYAVLEKYAVALRPWARAVAARMIADVGRRDEKAWREAAAVMGRGIRSELASAPTGAATRALLDEQVELITSLPKEAARRVQRLAAESLVSGGRARELAREIMRTGRVTQARANCIARTETSRAQMTFTQVRAQAAGSTHYVWRSSGDSDVRPSHRKLNGKTFAWNSPPVCEPTGERAHPGCIWNCRCWSDPVVPDYL